MLSPQALENLIITVVAGIILLIVGFCARWLYQRLNIASIFFRKIRLKYFPQTQVITFSIRHNDLLNSGIYFEEIKRIFLLNLEKYGLSSRITHRDFSDIYLFRQVEEAQCFSTQHNLDLILWGEFSPDNLRRGGGTESEFTLNFTYPYIYSVEKNKEAVDQDLKLKISHITALKNKWIINEASSLDDVRAVADGMFTTALFVLGLSLLNRGKISESVYVFEKLEKYLAARGDSTAALLKPYLFECYRSLLNSALAQKRVNWSIGLTLSEKIVSADPMGIHGLVSLAYFQFKSGLKDESEKTATIVMNHYPRKSVARVNFAFMQILRGNYVGALRHYKRVFQDKNPDFDTVPIVDFLYSEYEQSSEHGLLFASAGISYYFNGDNSLAEQDMRKFLLKGNFQKYGAMYREGERILELIKLASKVSS